MTRRPMLLELGTLVIVVLVALVLRVWPLHGASTDYDEGVYWQSLRAMAAGQPLFSAVFSSQPPLFLLGLYPFYLLFGQTLAAARLAVVLASLVSLLALYAIGRAIGGRDAGLAAGALLAVDPLYLAISHTLQAEVPALALALLGVALATSAPRWTGRRRQGVAVAAGLLIGLGTMTKLFAIVAILPAALYLALPLHLTVLEVERETHWSRQAATRDLLLLSGGVVVACAAIVLPFHAHWDALYAQVVTYHLAVAQTFLNAGWLHNLQLLVTAGRGYPLPLIALGACALAVRRRTWVVLPPLLWLLAAVVVLLRQQPLIAHQVTLLSPPLALLGGLALPVAVRPRRALPDARRQGARSARGTR